MNPCNFHAAQFVLPPDAQHVDDQNVVASPHDGSQGPLGTTVVVAMDAIRDRARREANRTNCRVARERMRERERQLQEVMIYIYIYVYVDTVVKQQPAAHYSTVQ